MISKSKIVLHVPDDNQLVFLFVMRKYLTIKKTSIYAQFFPLNDILHVDFFEMAITED